MNTLLVFCYCIALNAAQPIDSKDVKVVKEYKEYKEAVGAQNEFLHAKYKGWFPAPSIINGVALSN